VQAQDAALKSAKFSRVRVCHQCLYGREYNRQREAEYLSWVLSALRPAPTQAPASTAARASAPRPSGDGCQLCDSLSRPAPARPGG